MYTLAQMSLLYHTQYVESVDVADWFSGFCAIHDSSDGTPEEERTAPTPKPKKKRGRPSKKVLQRVSVPVCNMIVCRCMDQLDQMHMFTFGPVHRSYPDILIVVMQTHVVAVSN